MQNFRPYHLSFFLSVAHTYAENEEMKGGKKLSFGTEIIGRKTLLSDLEILAEFHYLWLTQTLKWLD